MELAPRQCRRLLRQWGVSLRKPSSGNRACRPSETGRAQKNSTRWPPMRRSISGPWTRCISSNTGRAARMWVPPEVKDPVLLQKVPDIRISGYRRPQPVSLPHSDGDRGGCQPQRLRKTSRGCTSLSVVYKRPSPMARLKLASSGETWGRKAAPRRLRLTKRQRSTVEANTSKRRTKPGQAIRSLGSEGWSADGFVRSS